MKQIQLLTTTKKTYTKNTPPKTTQKNHTKNSTKNWAAYQKNRRPGPGLKLPQKETINTTLHANLPTLINQNKPQPNQPTKIQVQNPKTSFQKITKSYVIQSKKNTVSNQTHLKITNNTPVQQWSKKSIRPNFPKYHYYVLIINYINYKYSILININLNNNINNINFKHKY